MDGFLHLLDGALEVAGGLRAVLVGSCLGGMDQHAARIVILIGGLHSLELLVIMGLAIEIDIIASVEGMPLTRGRSILLRTASSDEQAERRKEEAKCHFSKVAHNIKT